MAETPCKKKRRKTATTISTLLILMSINNVSADVLYVSPTVKIIEPPPSVLLNIGLVNDLKIYLFVEKENYVLPVDLCVNIDSARQYDSFRMTDFDYPIIPRGTIVDSYFLHFDPNNSRCLNGSVIFTNKILGIIVRKDELDASDSILGASETIYHTGRVSRGLETPDIIVLEDDMFEITFEFQAHSPGDQIRVICPEPMTLAFLSFGLFLLLIKNG